MKSFTESLKTVDDIVSKQLARLPELNKKLAEKFAAVRTKELEMYDQCMAIIAREGGSQVVFKDAGRTCVVEPLSGNRIKIVYDTVFNGSLNRHELLLYKERSDDELVPQTTDLHALSAVCEMFKRYSADVEIASRVIDTYVSYQNGLANKWTELADKIVGNDDDDDPEKSYW